MLQLNINDVCVSVYGTYTPIYVICSGKAAENGARTHFIQDHYYTASIVMLYELKALSSTDATKYGNLNAKLRKYLETMFPDPILGKGYITSPQTCHCETPGFSVNYTK